MVKIRPEDFLNKLNTVSSENHTNIATSGWWKYSPTTSPPFEWCSYTPPASPLFEFVRFENNKRRNIFTTSFYDRVTQAALCGADISGNVKLYIPQDKLDDYHTEEIDEFLSELRVYKEEGGIA